MSSIAAARGSWPRPASRGSSGRREGVAYVPSEGPPAVAALAGEETAWVARALRQRAVLEAARRRQEAAVAFAKTEKNGLLPDIGAFASVPDDRVSAGSSQAWAVGLGVRWTPFEPARGKREAAASADARAAEHDAARRRDQVRLEVRRVSRARGARAPRRRGGGAEEGREALRVVRERRKAGLATLTDELETEAEAWRGARGDHGCRRRGDGGCGARRAAGEL